MGRHEQARYAQRPKNAVRPRPKKRIVDSGGVRLVGYSMGAAVVVEYAARYGGCSGVVCVDGGFPAPTPEPDWEAVDAAMRGPATRLVARWYRQKYCQSHRKEPQRAAHDHDPQARRRPRSGSCRAG
jgi:pimeloyl-ACP methyl ester carboxylesterase